MATRLLDIEGIGVVYSQKLMSVGIRSVEQLLGYCGQKKARAALAGHTGISEQLVLTWVNKADLCRIDGVGYQFADLLERAGINSVAALAQRDPMQVYNRLIEVNNQGHWISQMPNFEQVAKWVELAKQLPVRVYH